MDERMAFDTYCDEIHTGCVAVSTMWPKEKQHADLAKLMNWVDEKKLETARETQRTAFEDELKVFCDDATTIGWHGIQSERFAKLTLATEKFMLCDDGVAL